MKINIDFHNKKTIFKNNFFKELIIDKTKRLNK